MEVIIPRNCPRQLCPVPFRLNHQVYGMVGDPRYMAPEQISGRGYGFGVDYWALGILLYVMLHEANPFGSNSSSETEVSLFWQGL